MYANKVTVAVSPQECHIRFSCMGPKFDEEGNIVSAGDIESCQVIMNRDMIIKLRDMITEVFEKEISGKVNTDE